MRHWLRMHPVLSALAALCAIVTLIPSCGTGADEASSEGDGAAEAGTHIVATFVAPGLDESGTQDLVRALAKNPGVLTAAALPDSGIFRVAFSAETTSAADVLRTVSMTNPTLALRNIDQVAANPGQSACAGCPSQATCGGEGK